MRFLLITSILTSVRSLAQTKLPIQNHHSRIRSFTKMADSDFVNATEKGEIPTFGSSDKAKATDFANYFCSYAQLYHQKQMLADHNRMAAYHDAIKGNADVFKDKVVMDVGTGSGILAAWAAQAGAKHVYASKSPFLSWLCNFILIWTSVFIFVLRFFCSYFSHGLF